MRRWGNASPGRARRVTVGTDWERYAAEQHPAQAYVSRRGRSSPSRSRSRRAPTLESTSAAPVSPPRVPGRAARATSPAARAKSPPASRDAAAMAQQDSAASAPPEVPHALARRAEANAVPPRASEAPVSVGVGTAAAAPMALAENQTPRRRATSPARTGDVRLEQRAALHDSNAYAAGAAVASSLATSPYQSPRRGERPRYRSPLRERRGYRSPLRQSPSPDRRARAQPQSTADALTLEPTASSSSTIGPSWQPAHWAQNSAGDGPSAYRGGSPRPARQRSVSSVRPALPESARPNVASPAALHLDNLLRAPPPPVLLRAARSPREHAAAELFLSDTAVRHDGVPYDPYRAAKVMSPARLRSAESSTATLLATQAARPVSSRAAQDVETELSKLDATAQYALLSPEIVAGPYDHDTNRHKVSRQQSFREAQQQSVVDKAVAEAFRRARSPVRGRDRAAEVRPAWEEGTTHAAALPPFRDIKHDDRLAAAERRHDKHALALQAAIAPESWAQRKSNTTSSLQQTTQPRARSPSTRRPVQLRPSTLAVNADALARAVATGDIEGVRRCLVAGTSPNKMLAGTQWSFLHSAAEMKNAEMVKLLLDSGAHPSLVTRHGGESPLHVVGDCAATVQALLDGGAQRGLRNFRGETPIDVARAAGHLAALRVLQPAGTTTELPTYNLKTPLHSAANETFDTAQLAKGSASTSEPAPEPEPEPEPGTQLT